jgi:hypothetical protein
VSTSTGSVTITNLGVTSLTAGTGTYVSASTGSITVWVDTVTPFDISTWTNQRLFTTSSVQFSGIYATTGTQVAQTISAGGYPLDGNGQANLLLLGSSTPALLATNYVSGKRPAIQIRSYSQNVTGGTTTTNAPAALYLETSRGTNTATLVQNAGDQMGVIQFSGYDGSIWPGTSGAPSNVTPARIYVTSSESWANNGTTTTNAGSRITMDLQPQGAWLNATSRQSWLNTSWTNGNTATNSAPGLNLDFGTTLNAAPTLTPASGFGSFGVGFGATSITYVNAKNVINGVTNQDPAPDNASILATNGLTFSANRQSGVSGRRQVLGLNDTVGFINFNAQTLNNGNTNGSNAAIINAVMMEASTSTAYGAKITFQTVSSGTTTISQRLSLDNLNNVYRSDAHTFNNAAGNTPTLTLVTGTNTYNNNTHNFNITGGATSIVQFNTSTGVALKGYSETVTTAAYTATFAPLVSTATIFKMTLTGNITFNGFTLPQAGQSAVFFFTQDATGGRLLTSSMKFSNASKTLSTAGTSTDMISVVYDGSTYYASLVKGFA